jgi:hypothetical protein
MGLALGLIANDLVGLPQAIFPREALYWKFEALHVHGYLKNGWSGNYLVGSLSSFYHNSAPVNKKNRGPVSSDFGNPLGFDYGSNGAVDERNCQFKYSKWNVPVGTRSKPRPFDVPD